MFVVLFNLQAFLVQNVQPLHDYKSHADNYICSLIPGTPYTTAQYTPGPLDKFFLTVLVVYLKSITYSTEKYWLFSLNSISCYQ